MNITKMTKFSVPCKRKAFPIALAVAAFLKFAHADLPIHATVKDIQGTWKFHLSHPVAGYIHNCGSTIPNRNSHNLRHEIADFNSFLERNGGVARERLLTLSTETLPFNQVESLGEREYHRASWAALTVKDGSTKDLVGRWSAVYDEGFEISLQDQSKLMAILKYNSAGGCSEISDMDVNDHSGVSECYKTDPNRTQIGWYVKGIGTSAMESGCFYAEKVDGSSLVETAPSFVMMNGVTAPAQGLESGKSVDYYISKNFVDKHNQKASRTWEASHASVFLQENRQGLSFLVKDFGYKKMLRSASAGEAPSFVQGLAQNKSLIAAENQLYACPCKHGERSTDTRHDAAADYIVSPLSMLQQRTVDSVVRSHENNTMEAVPKVFSWPNPYTHQDFNEDNVNQGSCGSCYAVAAAFVLERRFEIEASRIAGRNVRIFSKPDSASFLQLAGGSRIGLSAQSVLSCSVHNQGCNGGYPYLVGKFSEEIGFLQEGVMPYVAKHDEACKIANMTNYVENSEGKSYVFQEASSGATPEKRWYAKKYGYVGGCYECNLCNGEENIQREIMAKGPVVAAFDAPPHLFTYVGGVFDVEDRSAHSRVCDFPCDGKSKPVLTGWEYTNHAVSLIGWGEDADEGKYWIVRNTWGPSFGKKGYFKLRRGTNLGGIESQATYLDPDMSRGMGLNVAGIINKTKKL